MADTSDLAFVGEIRCFPYDFVPKGWLKCDGSILQANRYQQLAALITNTYGGNAVEGTFALPNLVKNVAVAAITNPLNAPGYANRQLGDSGGEPTVTLGADNLPNHQHRTNVTVTGTMELNVSILPGSSNDPTNSTLARPADASNIYSQTPNDKMGSGTASVSASFNIDGIPEGWALPHNNIQPCLALVYCICIDGVYPTFP